MTNARATERTSRSSLIVPGANDFMRRSEIDAMETRFVRRVEEVTSGAEATQNLLRQELKQEVEQYAERHLSRLEGSCTLLTCRLNDVEHRWAAAQLDTMAELTSVKERIEAVSSKSLTDRVDEVDKRLQSSRQDLFIELAKLRAEFTARSEEAAKQRQLEIRTYVDALKELGTQVAEAASIPARLGAVEQQLAAARSQPSKSAAATPIASAPATLLLLERLEVRAQATEKQLAAGLRDIEELRTIVLDSRSDMKLMSESFTSEHQEYQKLLANASNRQPNQQANGQKDTEFQGDLTSQATEIALKLGAELRADIDARIAATERDTIASVKGCLGAGFQAVLSELMNHAKRLQSASAQAVKFGPRIANIENELRAMARLVTSLANRDLVESNILAGLTGAPTSEEHSTSTGNVKSDMIGVIEDAIRGAFEGSSGKYPVGKSCSKTNEVDGTTQSANAADVSSESTTTRADHEGSESSQAELSAEDHLTQHSRKDSAPNGLFESLQTLANTIDKTIGSMPCSTSPAQHSGSLTAAAALHTSSMMSVSGASTGGSAKYQTNPVGAGGSAKYQTNPVGAGGSAKYQTNPVGAELAKAACTTADLRAESVPLRGRSVEQAKLAPKVAAYRPHTILGTQRTGSVPVDKSAVKRQRSSTMQPGWTTPRTPHTPMIARTSRHNTPKPRMEVPMSAGMSVEVLAAQPAMGAKAGQAVRISFGAPPSAAVAYRMVAPSCSSNRGSATGFVSPAGRGRPTACRKETL